MARKRHTADEIGAKSTQIACREAGISEQSFRDELLNGEIFYSLKEAKVVIGQWRHHYNTVRPVLSR